MPSLKRFPGSSQRIGREMDMALWSLVTWLIAICARLSQRLKERCDLRFKDERWSSKNRGFLHLGVNRAGQISKKAFANVLHRPHFTMYNFMATHHFATKGLADRLMT